MNVITDIGENVTVWETEPASSSTLADDAFAPLCDSGIERYDDYEPVVFQSNRALMAANAAAEINEIQERNHATTAYSTLDCVATPLFPTFNAQRKKLCHVREQELDARDAFAAENLAVLNKTYMLQRQQIVDAVAPPAPPAYVNVGLYNDAPYSMGNGGCVTYGSAPSSSSLSSMESVDMDSSTSSSTNGSDNGDNGLRVPFMQKARRTRGSRFRSEYDVDGVDDERDRKNNNDYAGYILLWVALALLTVILICVVIKAAREG
jgi:hypothetical protein